MHNIERSKWVRVVINGKTTARVVCPGCGMTFALDHDIASDGTVTPSMICPIKSCGFHEYVKLEGWVE
jgi:hypothetical protein